MNFKELAIALGQSDGVLFTKTELEECVALVAAQEREECAKVCDAHGLFMTAQEIRARSKA